MSRPTRFASLSVGGLAIVLGLGLGLGPPDPKVPLGRTWPRGELVPIEAVDHRAWDALLKRYVDPRGGVDYARWRATPADICSLDGYLDGLSRGDPGLQAGRGARLSFWINAYNAVTVKGILRERPTASIQDLAAEGGGYNIWRDLVLVVGGTPYSLGEIENKALRTMGEPRAHFAIVCASRGCPRLLDEAYTAATVEEQLERNARSFFADGSRFRFDPASGSLGLSPILDWYAGDFGGDPAERLRAIAPYLPDEKARQLAKDGKATVKFLDYDWGLNDRSTRASEPADRKGKADGGRR
jgi:hypothetical protein